MQFEKLEEIEREKGELTIVIKAVTIPVTPTVLILAEILPYNTDLVDEILVPPPASVKTIAKPPCWINAVFVLSPKIKMQTVNSHFNRMRKKDY